MDEQLRERLEKYMDTIESTASKAGEFVLEQTPLVAQEFLGWTFWSAIMSLIGCLLFSAIGFGMFYSSWNAVNQRDEDEIKWTLQVGLIVLWISSVIVPAIGVPVNASTAVKVKVAPRVVLIEKIAELRKSR